MLAVPEPAATATAARQITAERDLADYLWATFGVRVPSARVCPHHRAPWEAFCAAYFATAPVIVIKASRGFGGKTFLLGLLATVLGTVLRADVTVLGGSGGQSQRVLRAMRQFWNAPNAPRDVLRSEPGRMRTEFAFGNEVEALTASQRSVRSPHPQALLLDEVDEMPLDIFEAAMGQTLSARGIAARTVISSTHQYPDGTMTAVLKMAQEKHWPVYEFCYRETLEPHGWLLASEVARKRTEMTEAMWLTEVELQEPTAEGLAIVREAVAGMFRGPESDGKPGVEERWEEPVGGATYAHGSDWGKRTDYSATATLRTDVKPMRFVALYRDRRRPYYVMAETLNERQRDYGGPASHDANGVGEAVGEHLTGDEVEHFRTWQGPARIRLFSRYIKAVESGSVLAPRSRPWVDAHRYLTNADLYGTGHPPDEFVACALAYRAATGGGVSDLAIVTGNEPKVEDAAKTQQREAERKAAAAKVVTDRIRTEGVYWPSGGGRR
jgi:hypothetical protein